MKTIKQLILFFLFYAFIGWILDTSYRSLIEGYFAPGSITFLPFTPIYGFGALLILLVYKKIQHLSAWMLFIIFAVIATFFEYIGGALTLAVLGHRLWDYSNLPLNLHGHTSLLHAFIWGILTLILVKILHPFIVKRLLPAKEKPVL